VRALWLGLALFLITGVSPTSAHDIGVVQAELLEGNGNRYVISVSVRPAAAYVFQAPILPKRCLIMGDPRGAQGSDQLRFEFVCDKALTAVDELRLPWRREGAMLTAKWRDGSEAKRFFPRKAGHIPVRLSDLLAGSGSWKDAAGRYFDLGVEHILLGIDHLLFVLALLLIVRGGWMLVKTITAFTVAHSITLALATLGFINVPPRPLEAMIALSIVFLCVEIVHARQGRTGLTYQYPWLVAFAFGLLHGLGFAGALSEIGLALSEIPLALLFFNIGVEIGQLMFVVGLLGFLWGLQRLQFQAPGWARAIPVYAIGTLATYWLLERLEAIVTAV
jgi:hydrogenase/urease accessory protein HupE